MSSNFPTAIDSFTDPTASNKTNSPSHSTQHINSNDAIEKLETKVGVDGSAVVTSIDYLLKDTTGGHDHDGSDSKKVLVSNLNISGYSAYKSPRANSGASAFEAFDASTGSISFVIDGGGAEIQDGVAGDLTVPFGCEITGVVALADQSGSIIVDIWKDTYASYPPTDADSITSATPPTIASAIKATDTTLSGWTKTIAAGDTLRYNVDSCTTITRCTISLTIRRS